MNLKDKLTPGRIVKFNIGGLGIIDDTSILMLGGVIPLHWFNDDLRGLLSIEEIYEDPERFEPYSNTIEYWLKRKKMSKYSALIWERAK